MKYKSIQKNAKGGGKAFFFSVLTSFIVLVAIWYVIFPNELGKCNSGVTSGQCSCPSNLDGVSRKNVILIDTTDYIAPGKFPDIENLIQSYAFRPEPFFKWLTNGKKVEMTSVYLLSEKIPADMLPIGKFCRPPPEISLIASNSNEKVNKIKAGIQRDFEEAFKPLKQLTQAKASPIIETIAVVTSNATAWTPGGDLILVSDMLQNSAACGWFEKQDPIQKITMTPMACKSYIDRFQANAQPTQLHREKTNVAVCLLPPIDGKKPKDGLMAYWHNFFQDALSYDLLESCDPNEINDRRAGLRKLI